MHSRSNSSPEVINNESGADTDDIDEITNQQNIKARLHDSKLVPHKCHNICNLNISKQLCCSHCSCTKCFKKLNLLSHKSADNSSKLPQLCAMNYMVDHTYSSKKTINDYIRHEAKKNKHKHSDNKYTLLNCCHLQCIHNKHEPLHLLLIFISAIIFGSGIIFAFLMFVRWIFASYMLINFISYQLAYAVTFWFGASLILFGMYKLFKKLIYKRIFDSGFISNKHGNGSVTYEADKWKCLFGIAPLLKHVIHAIFVLLLMIASLMFKYDLLEMDRDSEHDIGLFAFLDEFILGNDADDALEDERGTVILFVCVKILFGLLIFSVLLCVQKFLVRWQLTSFYLQNYQASVENLLKIENYLRFILQREEIFEPNIMQFLVQIPLLLENPDLVSVMIKSLSTKYLTDLKKNTSISSYDESNNATPTRCSYGDIHLNTFCCLLNVDQTLRNATKFGAHLCRKNDKIDFRGDNDDTTQSHDRDHDVQGARRRSRTRRQSDVSTAQPPLRQNTLDNPNLDTITPTHAESLLNSIARNSYVHAPLWYRDGFGLEMNSVNRNSSKLIAIKSSSDIIKKCGKFLAGNMCRKIVDEVFCIEDIQNQNHLYTSSLSISATKQEKQEKLALKMLTKKDFEALFYKHCCCDKKCYTCAKNNLTEKTKESVKPKLKSKTHNLRVATASKQVSPQEKTYMGPAAKYGRRVFRMFHSGNGTCNDKLTQKQLEQFLTGILFRIVNNRCQFESFASILHSVDKAARLFVVFLTVLSFLLMFAASFVDALSIYATIVAVSVYIFGGSTLSRLMNGIMLVFAIRPFQVGDGILIDGKRYNVKQMGLFSTWMTDKLGIMHVWNNSELLNKKSALVNLSQTTNCKHKLTFYVDQNTTKMQLKQFLKTFQELVNIDKTTQLTCGEIRMIVNGFDQYMRSEIELLVESHISFVDSEFRYKIQTKLYELVKEALNDQDCKIKMKMVDIGRLNLTLESTDDANDHEQKEKEKYPPPTPMNKVKQFHIAGQINKDLPQLPEDQKSIVGGTAEIPVLNMHKVTSVDSNDGMTSNSKESTPSVRAAQDKSTDTLVRNVSKTQLQTLKAESKANIGEVNGETVYVPPNLAKEISIQVVDDKTSAGGQQQMYSQQLMQQGAMDQRASVQGGQAPQGNQDDTNGECSLM